MTALIHETALRRVIRLRMGASGINMADLAARADVPVVTLARRMAGATSFRVLELARVAAVFDLELGELVREADAMAESLNRAGTNTITDRTMCEDVTIALGAFAPAFDVEAIVRDLIDTYGRVRPDGVPADEFWAVVARHDYLTRGGTTGTGA